jgi:hypothetical protein
MDLTGIRDIAQQLEPHEKRLEGPVAKQKMFSLATKQVQLKIEHAKSEWEDASSRNAADREVRKFLKDRLRKNVNALGSAQLEKVRLNTATRKMTFLKKQVHDSANMQDSQLKSEEDYRAAALNEKQRELSALTMRIDLLKNTRKHQTQTQAQSDAAGQEKVSKLKKDIKLLVKVVKRLEADRTTVLKSARQYETKLARLKEQVNVTGEF